MTAKEWLGVIGCKNILLFEGGEFWIDSNTIAGIKRLEWLSESNPDESPKKEDEEETIDILRGFIRQSDGTRKMPKDEVKEWWDLIERAKIIIDKWQSLKQSPPKQEDDKD